MSVSAYLKLPPRSLREVCHEAGRDGGGRKCLDCPLADICIKQAQRIARKR
jgi:hypothetical protein